MSIINEALKKAVREKEASFSSEEKEVVRRNIAIEFEKKKSKMNWGPVFVLLVLVLITGPIVAPVFSTPFKSNSASTDTLHSVGQNISASSEMASAEAPTTGTRKAQFGIEEAPMFGNIQAQALSRFPQLSLSGIVYSPQESYCIINDKIVKVGDFVRGAQLVSVTQNEVKLDYQGKEVVLSVSAE